jgi:hypothetical protein
VIAAMNECAKSAANLDSRRDISRESPDGADSAPSARAPRQESQEDVHDRFSAWKLQDTFCEEWLKQCKHKDCWDSNIPFVEWVVRYMA